MPSKSSRRSQRIRNGFLSQAGKARLRSTSPPKAQPRFKSTISLCVSRVKKQVSRCKPYGQHLTCLCAAYIPKWNTSKQLAVPVNLGICLKCFYFSQVVLFLYQRIFCPKQTVHTNTIQTNHLEITLAFSYKSARQYVIYGISMCYMSVVCMMPKQMLCH